MPVPFSQNHYKEREPLVSRNGESLTSLTFLQPPLLSRPLLRELCPQSPGMQDEGHLHGLSQLPVHGKVNLKWHLKSPATVLHQAYLSPVSGVGVISFYRLCSNLMYCHLTSVMRHLHANYAHSLSAYCHEYLLCTRAWVAQT